ncbi:hypothetical protein G6F68_019173 [Rhizopus microsporus]|nr:hypothetical protein G6F68_019173 [Rhizopus microsporus]
MAPGTLPRAMEVNAMDDCTVDDKVQTNSTPSHSDGDEGARKDQRVQAHILHTRHDGVCGQARAMQEEQQRNGHIAGHHHEGRALAHRGKEAGEHHRGDQDERELVGQEAAHGGRMVEKLREL